MKIQVTVMGKTVEVELNNIIGSLLTTKSDNTLDSSMKTTVMDTVRTTNEFTDTELQILESMLNSDNYESFSQFKQINDAVVFQTAHELIQTKGSTTSLEIRDELRSKGYWARCFRIRQILQDDYSNQNLKFDYNGKFRVWTNQNPVSVNQQVSTTSNIPVPQTNNTAVPKSKCYASTKIGNWTVWCGSVIESIKNVTRNAARWQFARKNNLEYKDVRATIDKS